MVMLSDSESHSKEATPMAVGDVRDADLTSPANTDESSGQTDSLLMFSSEGTPSDASYVARRPSVIQQPSRPFSGHAVPAAIIDDRALREAISKLDGYADTLAKLQALCAAIDSRLEKAEETLRRTEEATSGGSLHELSARIDSRLAETEQAALRIERMVASGAVEEQSALQALRGRIGEQLEKTEQAALRIERMVASGAVEEQSVLQALRTHIGEQVEKTEAIARRTEGVITRVMGTEEVVRRIEQLVTSRSREELSALQAIHVDIDRRLSQAEDALRRPLAGDPPLSPGLVMPDWQRVMKPLAAVIVLAVVSILFMMKASTGGTPPVERRVDREVQLRNSLVATPAPSAPIPLAIQFRPPPPIPPAVAATPSPQPRPPAAAAPSRRAAAATPASEVAPRGFVGDLSIASTPAGARVFINGLAVGVTPLVLYERQAGSVAIQIASEGFERWSASVQVRAGQMTSVAATLRPARP
jgi:hypothetical protein